MYRVVDGCALKELCMSNTNFKLKCILKYSIVARGDKMSLEHDRVSAGKGRDV